MFQKKGSEFAVGEIAKEIQENKEITVSERIDAPEIVPKSEMSLDKANDIYDKYTEDIFVINNESEQTDENIGLEDVYNEIYECDVNDFSFENLDL